MQVKLTPQAEDALRQQLARSPGREPAQIVEEALTELVRRQPVSQKTSGATFKDFHAWLRELRQGVEPVPDLAHETFRREVIYQDHD